MAETKADMIDLAEEIVRDLELGTVSKWKEKTGGKAVGCMPVWSPRELLHAAGILPVGIVGGGDGIEIIKGDAYFQSYICQIPRSTIEMGLNGNLSPLDGMIFPSICDVIRNLSGMWKMLFPKTPAWYLDMPQSFDEIGVDFFTHELKRLFGEFCRVSGQNPDNDSINRSIAIYNENRSLIEELYQKRRERPWCFPVSEGYLLIRAGYQIDVKEHNKMLRSYIDLAAASDCKAIDNARVVVLGSFCEQPPLNLIRTIEKSGCYVVEDDFTLGARLIKGEISTTGDAIENLARAFIEQSREAAFIYRESEKGGELVEKVKKCNAEGVVCCAPSFCDPALLDQPMMVAAIEKASIPYTSFKYAENTGQFQVIREQAGTFADSIKLWS